MRVTKWEEEHVRAWLADGYEQELYDISMGLPAPEEALELAPDALDAGCAGFRELLEDAFALDEDAREELGGRRWARRSRSSPASGTGATKAGRRRSNDRAR